MRRRLRIFAVMAAIWTAYAVFSASQNVVSRVYGSRIDWKTALRYASLDSYTWLALTPAAFWIARRFALKRHNWWRTAPVLVAAGIALAAIHLTLFVRLLPFVGYPTTPRTIPVIVLGKLHADVLTCWVLFGLRHALGYYEQFRLRELNASQLEAKLAVAQLEALKMQLQPHFLFNALHAVSALMFVSADAADRMLARISEFLRLTLDSAGVQEVTLQREMEHLDKYLEIEQVRLGDRLLVRRSIDPAALDLMTPNLVLQPLVENAVRYAVAPRREGGVIEVLATAQGDRLIIEVADNGPGVPATVREGVGLSNTRARLERLYGGAAHFDAGNAPGGGFRVRIVIPTHREPAHADADR